MPDFDNPSWDERVVILRRDGTMVARDGTPIPTIVIVNGQPTVVVDDGQQGDPSEAGS